MKGPLLLSVSYSINFAVTAYVILHSTKFPVVSSLRGTIGMVCIVVSVFIVIIQHLICYFWVFVSIVPFSTHA